MKWLIGKDSYIRRLHLDIGMVHFFGVPGGYLNPPGEVLGLVGLIGGEEKGPRERGAPLAQTELD